MWLPHKDLLQYGAFSGRCDSMHRLDFFHLCSTLVQWTLCYTLSWTTCGGGSCPTTTHKKNLWTNSDLPRIFFADLIHSKICKHPFFFFRVLWILWSLGWHMFIFYLNTVSNSNKEHKELFSSPMLESPLWYVIWIYLVELLPKRNIYIIL